MLIVDLKCVLCCGSRDVELQGALSYKSFIDRLTESDFMCTGPSWLRQPLQKCRRPLVSEGQREKTSPSRR
jgi:hypothetical protein